MSAQTAIWRYDDIPSYDLTVEIVNAYLVELFGNYQFLTTVRGLYHFEAYILMRNYGRMPTMTLLNSGSPGTSPRLVAFIFCGEACCISDDLYRTRREP
jgi:hypothetical protein